MTLIARKTMTGYYTNDIPVHKTFDESLHELADPVGQKLQNDTLVLRGYCLDTPMTGASVFLHIVTANIVLPANLPNSWFWMSDTLTAPTTFTIAKQTLTDTIALGTITYIPGQAPTIDFPNPHTLLQDDILIITAPADSLNGMTAFAWAIQVNVLPEMLITPLEFFSYETGIDGITITNFDYNAFDAAGGGDIIIPDTINGLPVTTIGPEAFARWIEEPVTTEYHITAETYVPDVIMPENYNFVMNGTKIYLPENVVTIYERAFYGCGATALYVANRSWLGYQNQLHTIMREAFRYNHLTLLEFPEGIVKIEEGAFKDNKLVKVVLPNSIEIIEPEAFTRNRITNLRLPTNPLYTKIEDRVFETNELRISELTIPSNIHSIGMYAFANNHHEEWLIEPSQYSNLNYPDGQYDDLSIGRLTCANKASGKIGVLELLQNVYIMDYAIGYAGMFRYNKLTLPTHIDYISNGAFRDCCITELETIGDISFVGSDAFANNPMIKVSLGGAIGQFDHTSTVRKTIINPLFANMQSNYDYNPDLGGKHFGENNCDPLTRYPHNWRLPNVMIELNIENGTEYIGESAFANHLLTSVSLPNSLLELGIASFADNHLLTNLMFANESQLTIIPQNAFYSNGLENLVLPDGIEEIHENAFRNGKISALTLPESVTIIGNSAFQSNDISGILHLPTSLTSIGDSAFEAKYFPSGINPGPITGFVSGNLTAATKIGERAFWGHKISGTLVLGQSVDVGAHAFADNQIDTLTLNGGTIGENAFQNNNIQVLTLVQGVSVIGKEAFMGNYMPSISIPSLLTSIGEGAFKNVPVIEVDLPSDLVVIPKDLFQGHRLNTLSLPNSITEVQEGAFSTGEDVTSTLTNVIFNNGLASIGYNAFKGNSALHGLNLPDTLQLVEHNAFALCPIEYLTGVTQTTITGLQTKRDQSIQDGYVSISILGYPGTFITEELPYRPFGDKEIDSLIQVFAPEYNAYGYDPTVFATAFEPRGWKRTVTEFNLPVMINTPAAGISVYAGGHTTQPVQLPQYNIEYYVNPSGGNLRFYYDGLGESGTLYANAQYRQDYLQQPGVGVPGCMTYALAIVLTPNEDFTFIGVPNNDLFVAGEIPVPIGTPNPIFSIQGLNVNSIAYFSHYLHSPSEYYIYPSLYTPINIDVPSVLRPESGNVMSLEIYFKAEPGV